MTDPATYDPKRGFEGMDFYVAGRAGVLGEVPAAVATCFAFAALGQVT